MDIAPVPGSICQIPRRVASVRHVDIRRVGVLSSNNSNVTSLELDSHADTCCVGKHALIIQNYDKPVTVYGYDESLGPQTYDTVSAVINYTNPMDGTTIHLVIHQAIHIPTLDHHLLCPMQCRVNEVVINDCPKFLCKDPTETSHAIVVDDPTKEGESLVLPLMLQGVTSYLPVLTPTEDEWQSGLYPQVELTAQHLDWEPASNRFQMQEESMMDHKGEIVHVDDRERPMIISSLNSLVMPAANITDDDNFAEALSSKVRVSAVSSGNIRSSQGKAVDAHALSRRWHIPYRRAKNTVQRTTQRGVRQVLNPTLTRRYLTNDRLLRYPRLPHTVFTDTMIAGTVSQRGNKYAQVYATSYGWGRSFPMARKGDAHHTLDLLFKRDGVPPEMVMDGSKEQTQGQFAKKLRDAGCHKRQIEPYSPWMNAAESQIREIKRGSARSMLKQPTPKVLWDHCIELESRIRSCSALDIYQLDGEVPETKMMGYTADISNICEYEWYEWVMFIDAPAQFPDLKWSLGRYLGPSIDVGSAIQDKAFKKQIAGRGIFVTTTHNTTNQP